MKISLLLIFIMTSFVASAAKFNATVDDVSCVEVDPFVVGDVCIVSLTRLDGSKLALLSDVDSYYEQYYQYDIEAGALISVDDSTLSKIYRREVLNILQDYSEDYFYMSANPLKIELIDSDTLSKSAMENLLTGAVKAVSMTYLPEGYSAKKIEGFKLKRKFKQVLERMTAKKRIQWYEFVFTGGEYDHLTQLKKKEIARNPKEELQVSYLLEITNVYEIYQGDILVGYYLKVADHVHAATIQDGAWYDMFLDINQDMIKKFFEEA